MATLGYYLDLASFSLAKLKRSFETGRLLPSQRVLQEDIEVRFACLAQHGIENLAQLYKVLKTKADVQKFADLSGLPLAYLTVLRREVRSYRPKPINLRDFPGVNLEIISRLAQAGIKNTLHLFPYVLTGASRTEFAELHQIAYADVLELTKLTDVARIKWVGPKFARLLVASPYDTVEKIANSNGEEFYRALVSVNEAKNIYKGKFGIEDMRSWIANVVQDVPRVIEY